MKLSKSSCLAVLAILSATVEANANPTVVNFDDAYAALGNGGQPTNFYSAKGLTIGGNYSGVWGGNGNGNPGNWALEGTNGSAFLGVNSDSQKPIFTWSTPVDDLSLDIGVPGFGWTETIAVSGYLNGNLVATYDETITSPSNPGNWDVVDFSSPVTSVTAQIISGNGFAFGIDNVSWNPGAAASVPDEGSTLTLLGFALIAVGAVRRKFRF